MIKNYDWLIVGMALFLMFFGAGNQYFPVDISRFALVLNFVNTFLKQYGNLIFGICVTVACLSTVTTLTIVVSQFFSDIYGFSYKKVAYISCATSAFMANFGADRIVGVAKPILAILYSITLCGNSRDIRRFCQKKYNNSFRLSVYTTGCIKKDGYIYK